MKLIQATRFSIRLVLCIHSCSVESVCFVWLNTESSERWTLRCKAWNSNQFLSRSQRRTMTTTSPGSDWLKGRKCRCAFLVKIKAAFTRTAWTSSPSWTKPPPNGWCAQAICALIYLFFQRTARCNFWCCPCERSLNMHLVQEPRRCVYNFWMNDNRTGQEPLKSAPNHSLCSQTRRAELTPPRPRTWFTHKVHPGLRSAPETRTVAGLFSSLPLGWTEDAERAVHTPPPLIIIVICIPFIINLV